MTEKMKNSIYLISAIMFFYLCWGIPQFFMQNNLLSPTLNNWFFSIIFTGIAGCLIPILLRNKTNVAYSLKVTNRSKIIGLLLLLLSLVFGLLFSGALFKTIQLGYPAAIILKYILLFFPMSLGISLFAFLLLPRLTDSIFYKPINLIITSILTGAFFFIGFFIDSTFGNTELAFTMAFLGIFFGLSNWFTKNFWITFPGFFITVLINTLSEEKYGDYSLIIVLVSTAISFMILLVDIHNIRSSPKFCVKRYFG